MGKNKLYISIFLVLVLISIFLFSNSNDEMDVKIELCENITSGRLKVICYAMFLRDHTYCNLAGDFSTHCYDSIFPLLNLNESLCRSLNDDYARLSCFTNLAVKTNDVEMCEMLEEPAVITACYTMLFNYLDQFTDSSLCNKIPHESTRFACLAKVENNMTRCFDIVQEVEERGACLGMLTKNVSYCTVEAPDVLARITIYSCIKTIAIDLKDMDLCNEIDYEVAKWKCKASLAKDIGICNEATNPWKDFCKLEYIKNNLL